MKAFYGFCSYLWFFGTVYCVTTNGTGWDLFWWSLYVIIFAYVGKGVLYMITFAYKMMYNPAFYHDVMDGYIQHIMHQQTIRKYLKYGR